MPKISVIVPVYNTERYIARCLNSILFQENLDFEVIVVNDGSTDNSENIIKEFEEKYPDKIKYFEKQNGGLSDARNFGVKKAVGEYLCFVDSDDFINENLFEKLEKYILQGIELIKYKCIKINEKGEEIERIGGPVFECRSGAKSFNELYSADVLLEPAWLYLYKRDFFEENSFEFPVGKYHEDWAIVPFIVMSAKTMVSTDVYGYYYVQSANSITRNNDDEKTCKRAYDMLEHYDNLLKRISESTIEEKSIENFKIYITNCLILKIEELPAEYHKQYVGELRKRKVSRNIKARNFKQFIKKILLKINIELYLKVR